MGIKMNKKYVLCIFTSIMTCLIIFMILNMTDTGEKHLKIGFIFPGDAVIPYTANFMEARDRLADAYDEIECVTRYNVADDQVEEFINQLITEECDYIVAASYDYQEKVKETAVAHPEIQFCVPLGDNANDGEALSNYHTCSGNLYQGWYVCGVIAGEKLKEMIKSGIITSEQAKVGCVASLPREQTISGYTAFYLGVQSVVPEAAMLVQYTGTWADYYLERQAADDLIQQGCVIISQYSDTTGPAAACENAAKSIPVYHIGYNESMTDIAPTSSLVSCSVDYYYYFKQSVDALLKGKKIEDCIKGRISGQDATAGFKEGWVRILDMNYTILPENIDEIVQDTIKKLEKGKIQVFSDSTACDVPDGKITIVE